MPPPKITCAVCGQIVLKAQTVCIGKGPDGPVRCCKTHPEAAKAESWRGEQQAEHQEKRKTEETDRKYRDGHFPHLGSTANICWCCQNPGIPIQQMWMMMLEENLRSEMEGRPVMELFDGTIAKRVKKRIDDAGTILLIRFADLTAEQMTPLWRSKMPKMFKDLLPLTRGAILCPKCAGECGLKYEPPPVTMGQIEASAIILREGGLEQAIKDKISHNN